MSIPTIEEGSTPPGFAAAAGIPCRWLISLDYDGTLQNPAGPPILPEFFSQMQAWRADGVRWGINTGRSLDYLLQEIIPCSPALPDFICTCERYVYIADADGKLRPQLEHNAACHRHNAELKCSLAPTLHATLTELRRTLPHLEWELAADDPLSIEAKDSETMDALLPHLQPLVTPACTIQRAGRYMRFADARYSKGTALSLVLQHWQLSPENLFIMGDGQNDLDAFRMFPAAYCAAPPSAHPEVLDWLKHRPHIRISSEPGVLSELRNWYQERVQPVF